MPSPRRWADALRQDIGYALRGLRREHRFAAMVIATLSLGIGANAALFSLADRLFLRQPAGVAHPEQVHRLYRRTNWTVGGVTEITDRFSFASYTAMRDAMADRATSAAYTLPDSFRLGEGNDAPTVRGVYATHELLPMLGASAAIGRTFTAGEDQPDDPSYVAVLGHRLWTERFDGDQSIIGRTMSIARQRYTVIGVLPKDFTGVDLEPVDVWVPAATLPHRQTSIPWFRNWRFDFNFRVVTRATDAPDDWLATVATTALRRGELANVARNPDTATVIPGPLLAALGPSIHPRMEVAIATRLIGVVAIVLLIACANVANLILARSLHRRREFAVRIALGISRRRLLALPLIEGLILAVVSSFVAIAVAAWAGVALQRLILPIGEAPGAVLDWRMIAVAVSTAIVAGLAASVVPAWQTLTPDLTDALKAGARDGGGNRSRLRSTLVVAQVALSVILLVGAGLFVRSLRAASAIDLGLDADRLVTGSVQYINPVDHTVARPFGEIATTLRDVLPRVSTMPGVERATLATTPPLGGYAMGTIFLGGGRPAPRADNLDPAMTATSPNYFATLGMKLVSGRTYTDADDAGGERVAVVNEMTARTYWPNENPIGKCMMLFTADAPCIRVIGVVRDAHFDELVEKPVVGIYLPSLQHADNLLLGNPMFIIVRSAPGATARVAADLRRVLRERFPNAEPPSITLAAERVYDDLKPWRLGASIFSVFGALALLVAAIGVYSVIAYSVSQRTREMGIRMALGARASDVAQLVLSDGVRLVAVGILIGIAVALAAGGLLQSMLYGISGRDPLVVASVAVVLSFVAMVATILPARSASNVDPAVTLRAE